MAADLVIAQPKIIAKDKVWAMTWWAGAALFVAALVLRLWGLDAHGLWYDEAISIETAQHGMEAIFNQRFGWVGNQTPWHYLLVWLMIQPIDPTLTTVLVRLPSALAGALTVALTYDLGRLTFGRWQGLLAALLVCLSTTALDYSQDLRPYSLTTFFVVLAIYCLVRCALPGGSWGWWLLFTLSGVAAVYNSYAALVLSAPTLAICALWAFRRWTVHTKAKGASKLYPLGAISLFALLLVPTALSLAKIPGPGPDLSVLTPARVASTMYGSWTWLTRFGLPSEYERSARLLAFLFILIGAYLGLRSVRAGRIPLFTVWLSMLVVLLPAAELVVLGTSKPAAPRYIVFVLPFYCLLIANALYTFSRGMHTWLKQRLEARANYGIEKITALKVAYLPPAAALLVSLPVVLLFVIGVANYNTAGGYARLADRPDFRPVISLLNAQARSNDTIVIADNPPQNLTVSDLYWKDSPPAPVYSALDPRLFERRVEGNIYWAVATWDMLYIQSELLSDSRWAPLYADGRVVLLQEKMPQLGMASSLEYMSERLNALSPNRLSLALRGSVYQAHGDYEAAANSYTESGRILPLNLSSEFMHTAVGFAGLGDWDRAWRETMNAKLEDAGQPDVHRWLAQRLAAQGYTVLARQEEVTTRLLEERSQRDVGN